MGLSIVSCICSHPPPPFCASQLNSEVKLAKKELKKAQTIMQLDELKCRKRVLRRWEGRKGKKKGGWRKGRRGEGEKGRGGEGKREGEEGMGEGEGRGNLREVKHISC